jgi:hypothetical protein
MVNWRKMMEGVMSSLKILSTQLTGELRRNTKTSVRVASALAKIQTRYLANTETSGRKSTKTDMYQISSKYI